MSKGLILEKLLRSGVQPTERLALDIMGAQFKTLLKLLARALQHFGIEGFKKGQQLGFISQIPVETELGLQIWNDCV